MAKGLRNSKHVTFRSLKPGEVAPPVIRDPITRVGPYSARLQPNGKIEIVVDNEKKRPTLLDVLPSGTSDDIVHASLLVLERSRLTHEANAAKIAAMPLGEPLGRIGRVGAYRATDLNGGLWIDIWDHAVGAAKPEKKECWRFEAEPTKAEIVDLLQRRVDRVAREATVARRARAKQKEV